MDMRLQRRHAERLLLQRPLDQPAADRLDGNPDALDLAVDFDLDLLQVRLEGAFGFAGHLGADAAQILRLAAASVLIAAAWLHAGHGTLLAHESPRKIRGRWVGHDSP